MPGSAAELTEPQQKVTSVKLAAGASAPDGHRGLRSGGAAVGQGKAPEIANVLVPGTQSKPRHSHVIRGSWMSVVLLGLRALCKSKSVLDRGYSKQESV